MTHSILVTGSNSGFGRRIVETLAKDGHQIFASMRHIETNNAEAAEELEMWAKQEGFTVHVVELDVTSDTSVAEAIRQSMEIAGQLDVVVNNAGVACAGLSEAFTIEQVQGLFDVNVFGPLRVDKAVLPYMRKHGSGLLVHISSTFGRLPMPFSGLYSASKCAVEGVAEASRYELLPLGIDSVIVEPGPFPTELGTKLIFPADEQIAAEYGKTASGGQKLGEALGAYFKRVNPDPQDVADAVKHLVDMPCGERPLRTVVDGLTGDLIETVNTVAAQNQPEYMQRCGIVL